MRPEPQVQKTLLGAISAAAQNPRDLAQVPDEICLGIVGLHVPQGTWKELDFLELRRVDAAANLHELQRAINDSVIATVLSRYSAYVAYELAIKSGLASAADAPGFGLSFANLLRIRVGPEILIPGSMNSSWTAHVLNRLPERSCAAALHEDIPNSLSIEAGATATHDDLRWVLSGLGIFRQLYSDREQFGLAVDAFCQHTHQSTKRMAAAMLWSGIEALFGTRGGETTYRLAMYVASYLEPIGDLRLSTFRDLKNAYNTRSRVVHGSASAEADLDEHLRITRSLLQRLLQKMIVENSVPSSEQFDQMVLAPISSPTKSASTSTSAIG